MKKGSLLFLAGFLIAYGSLMGQINSHQISFSNSSTSLPLVGLPKAVYANFLPGLDYQFNQKLNESVKNQWYVNYQGGFIYHRFVQTLVSFSGNMMYQTPMGSRFSFNAGLGAGFGAAFTNEAVAKLNQNGEYDVRSPLMPRMQYVLRFQTGILYALDTNPESIKLSLQLRTMMQGVFVNNYVPLLPINSVMVGIVIPVKTSNNP